jgi:SsrA-binding protein
METYEAGIVLTGDEIKSIRKNGTTLKESFATVTDEQVFIINWNITPYSHAYDKSNDYSRRTRKLLLHRKQISSLIGAVARKGLTLVPLRLFFNARGYVKIEIGLAKHKKLVDKRKSIKDRDIAREAQRDLKIKLT